MAREEARARVIEDSVTLVNMKVNNDGSINAVTNPVTPPAATQVVHVATGNVASSAGVDSYYTITSGKTLTLQVSQASIEQESGGSVVELFEDPNGDLSVLNRIGIPIILDGSTYEETIQEEFIGDGTNRIVLRRRGFTASAREINARWVGYEE